MRTLQILVRLVLLLTISFATNAQITKKDGVSSITNKMDQNALISKIDSLLATEVGENEPGGAIGVIYGDKVLVKKGYGISNLDQKSGIDANTIFDIASVSKHFTAYAILLLEKKGKLRLDDNIRDYLPRLPAYEHAITIRNLIQHTSGIASTDVLRLLAGWSYEGPWSQKDEIDLITSYPQLNFAPNTQHLYSNSGYSLLAEIVEAVSRMKFSEFLKEKIFDPLEMKASFVFDDPEMELSHCAKGYKRENDRFVPFSNNQETIYGQSNIYTSLNDMIRWGQNILAPKNGPMDYINRISHPYNTLSNGDTLTYTYGFEVKNYKGVKLVAHSGGTLGFRSQFLIFPDEQLVLILMLNTESVNSRRLAYGIADLLLADKLKEEAPRQRVAIKVDREALVPMEGTYQMPDGIKLGFELMQDTLWLVLPGEEKFQLYAESPTKFFLKAFDAQCTFVTGSDGEINEMTWHQGGKDYKSIRYVELEPLTEKELAQYAGSYYHEILKAEYTVAFQEGNLILTTPDNFKTYLGFNRVTLSHIGGDKFYAPNLSKIQFTRNKSNQIDGFVLLDVGRIQNIRFSKKHNQEIP